MEKDWKLIYTTNKPYQAELIKQKLENDGIESVVINKHDSTYNTFGEAEIYVNENNKEKAIYLIKNLEF